MWHYDLENRVSLFTNLMHTSICYSTFDSSLHTSRHGSEYTNRDPFSCPIPSSDESTGDAESKPTGHRLGAEDKSSPGKITPSKAIKIGATYMISAANVLYL
jgi:hypothetical protein